MEPAAPSATQPGPGRVRVLVVFGVALIVALLPFGGIVGYPLALIATWAHELGHALMAVVAGQTVVSLEVFTDTSGRTAWVGDAGVLARGLVASSGYVGTAVVAAVAICVGRHSKLVRPALGVLGASMVLTSMVFGGAALGRVFIAGLGAVVLTCAFLRIEVAAIVLDMLAATLALNAFSSLRALYQAGGTVQGVSASSDAETLAEIWFGPGWMWTTMWIGIAVVVVLAALVYRLRSDGSPAP